MTPARPDWSPDGGALTADTLPEGQNRNVLERVGVLFSQRTQYPTHCRAQRQGPSAFIVCSGSHAPDRRTSMAGEPRVLGIA
jgi:hypothetical protein